MKLPCRPGRASPRGARTTPCNRDLNGSEKPTARGRATRHIALASVLHGTRPVDQPSLHRCHESSLLAYGESVKQALGDPWQYLWAGTEGLFLRAMACGSPILLRSHSIVLASLGPRLPGRGDTRSMLVYAMDLSHGRDPDVGACARPAVFVACMVSGWGSDRCRHGTGGE